MMAAIELVVEVLKKCKSEPTLHRVLFFNVIEQKIQLISPTSRKVTVDIQLIFVVS